MMSIISRLSAALSLAALTALAQNTVESIPFRVNLSPRNEVPAITDLNASGFATVWLHIVRDSNQQIVSGSVDFNIRHSFPGAASFTGLHIHEGRAGVNGPVVIDSGLRNTDNLSTDGTAGSMSRQGQVLADATAGLAALRGVLESPAGYYVNLHTQANPGGALRGQMMRADLLVLSTRMSPENEVPAITGLDARGLGNFYLIASRSADGTAMSAEATFDISYTGFPENTSFTGLHIHTGRAGVNGPVTINSGMQGGANAVPVGTGGSGRHLYTVDVPMMAAAMETVSLLFNDPTAAYLNLHTVTNPGGAIRGQTRRTDPFTFTTNLSPRNEVPPIRELEASAPTAFTVYALRAGDGTIEGGAVAFDVNYRFPGSATFTGLHIHDGVEGVNGPVTINSGLAGGAGAIETTAGFGNIYRLAPLSSMLSMTAAMSVAANPERHYLNLHTTLYPGGAVRAQVAAAERSMPAISAIISSVSDSTYRTTAPGGLITLFGSRFARAASELGGWAGMMLPGSLNGTSVTVGGRPAALFSLSTDAVVVQTPVDAATGMQPVIVRNGVGPSEPMMVRVNETAPGVFFDRIVADGNVAVAFRMDGTQVTDARPAMAGEVLIFYTTGLGATMPALGTGQVAPANPLSMVSATIRPSVGGRDAALVGAAASPGFAGLSQVAIRMPEGVRAGFAEVVLMTNGATGNRTVIPVR
jgi:uncharacterized protein (TIGR03437 family)